MKMNCSIFFSWISWGKKKKQLEEKLLEAIYFSLEKLPEKRKLVFIKTKIEGKKNKEVAEELGISLKAIEKHMTSGERSNPSGYDFKIPAFVCFDYSYSEIK